MSGDFFSGSDFPTVVIARADIAAPRYGQLTYTSFDRPSVGRGQVLGGWQVKDLAGDLDENEQEAVRAGVNTRLETVVAPPQFPTQEQIDSRPRRLHYGPLPAGAVAYWHSTPAGSDASGRPGNVFVHALVDRTPDLPPLRRPISLWHSTGWLTPYGADVVADSTLGATADFPEGKSVALSQIVNFVLDPEVWRIGVLCVLLDAVNHAMHHGGTVILGVEGPDRGAQWIGAVSALMSSSAASHFYFSTYERRPSAEDIDALNAHVVCVPIEDLADLELPEKTVVLSEVETPSLGELGAADGSNHESHRTERNAEVQVSEWSVLAQTVLLDAETALGALGQLDEIAKTDPVRGAEIAWPLAALVSENNSFSDAHVEARRVLDGAPKPLRRIQLPEPAAALAVSVARAPGHVPGATESGEPNLHNILAMPISTSAEIDARWTAFLHFVRNNPGWSMGSGTQLKLFGNFESHPSRRLLEDVQKTAEDFFDRLEGKDSPAESDTPFLVEVEILRFADLIMHSGLVDDAIVNVVQKLVDLAVVPLLLDDSVASQFVRDVLSVEAPLRALLRSCITDGTGAAYFVSRPLGSRVPKAVIEWMLLVDDLPTDGSIRENAEVVAESSVALASDLVLRRLDNSDEHDLNGWGQFVPQALWRVLWEAHNGGFVVGDASKLLTSTHIPEEDLEELAWRFPGIIPPRFLQRIVLSHTGDQGSVDLARSAAHLLTTQADTRRDGSVIVTPPNQRKDDCAVAWARLRSSGRWAEFGAELQFEVTRMRPALVDFCRMSAAEITALTGDLVDRMMLLIFASRWARDRYAAPFVPFVGAAQVDALRRSVLGSSDYVSVNITELITSRIIDREWLLATVMLMTSGAPGSKRRKADVLTHVGLGADDGNGLLEIVAGKSLSDLQGFDREGPSPIADMFRDEVRRRRFVDSQAVIDQYRPHAWSWLDHLAAAAYESKEKQMWSKLRIGKRSR